ncbi:putative polygalacturonase [Vitis vinifera]|uniref:Putative polygalacturonase n=1 Tax=Vitis vinifera TaxID=29760 RepID=A0A438DWV8_VITVI|nr:putative polygalacturonase [Vitis vinifera]
MLLLRLSLFCCSSFLGVLLLLPLFFFFFFLFGHQGIIAAEALTTHEDASNGHRVFAVKGFSFDVGWRSALCATGKWLTGSFNLTSHLTLFLERGAVILGSQDPSHWEVIEPLPSYGRGIELPGGRYRSLINGRPHLVEFLASTNVVVSNLTFLNAPAYNIHPVYCSKYSSDSTCIEDCSIAMGHDAIALKSGWDEYGIAYGRPTTNVHIRRVNLQSSSGSSLAFGSEMSGGISNVCVEQVHLYNSFSGIEFRTTKGRGGYIQEIIISDVAMENIHTAFSATGQIGSHPDDHFDPNALPVLDHITLQNVIGTT